MVGEACVGEERSAHVPEVHEGVVDDGARRQLEGPANRDECGVRNGKLSVGTIDKMCSLLFEYEETMKGIVCRFFNSIIITC